MLKNASEVTLVPIFFPPLLEELYSAIPTLLRFPPKRQSQRSWGSELAIHSVKFVLQFVSEQVVLQGAMTNIFGILESSATHLYQMSPQLCNLVSFFASSHLDFMQFI